MLLGLACAACGAVLAYFLGSFPTSYLAGRALKGIDIRQHGSGNVGATNAYRVIGKGPGLFVLVVDLAKGWAAAGPLASHVLRLGAPLPPETIQSLFGLCAVCGHIWSPFLRFRGGKGVATATGVLLALSPVLAGLAVLVWMGVAMITRYVSVSSIVAVTAVPLVMAVTAQPASWVAVSVILCLIIVAKHRPNIDRLRRRQEPRIGERRG